jgi:hypothetical protein
MFLEGNLSDMPVMDIFNIMSRFPNNCILQIDRTDTQAGLVFKGGQPFAAWINRLTSLEMQPFLTGEDAFHTIINWDDGLFFVAEKEKLTFSRNLHLSKDQLILKKNQEKPVLNQPQAGQNLPNPVQFPGLKETSLVRTVSGYRTRVLDMELNFHEWSILIQLDGELTIRELANLSKIKPETTLLIVNRLIELGLIEYIPTNITSPTIYNLPSQPPKYRKSNNSETLNRLTQALNTASPSPVFNLAGVGTPVTQPYPSQSQVQPPKRGILSSIMAKLRGL